MWFGLSRKPRPASTARSRRRSARPRLEALEDRCVPNAGYLDPTFGAAGAGALTNGGAPLIQSNGEIIAGGGTGVTLYNTNGTLDTSFGSGGTATTIPISAMTLQSDGKILLVGGGTSNPRLERLNSNGSPDTSFGTNGIVSTPNFYHEIVVQPNGQIVVAGQINTSPTQFDLSRYNSNGTLDKSFGQRGTATTFVVNQPAVGLDTMLLQSNGELMLVGHTYLSALEEWVMARFNANGSLDTSFGNQGIATTPSAIDQGGDGVGGAVLYPNLGTPDDGKIAIVGTNAGLAPGPVPLLARFNTNGSVDTSFGSGGYVPLGVSPGGVAFDSSQRFVIDGSSNNDTALERLNLDGTPDPTFGSNGVVTAGLPGTGAGGVPAIYPSTGTDTADYGKIVTGGSHVARFLPAAPASAPSFVVTGTSSTTAGAPFSVTVTATDANGNVLSNYTGTVDFSSFDPQAVLPPNYTFTAADQGVHTFTVTFKTAALQEMFVADTATPGMNGREVGLQVNPGAVARFILEANTTSVKRGAGFFLWAEAVDAYGNVTTFNGNVHFSSSDPNATLPGDENFAANSGNLGTFILRTRGRQTITMTDDDDPSIIGTLTFQVS